MAHEVVLTTVHAMARSALTAVIALALGFVTVALVSADVDGFVSRIAAAAEAGSNVWVVRGEAIDVGLCDSLASDPSVLAAGAILDQREQRGKVGVITVSTVTSGMLRVAWSSTSPTASVVAGRDAVEAMGLVDGAYLTLGDVPSDHVPTGAILQRPIGGNGVRIDQAARSASRVEELDDDLAVIGAVNGMTGSCYVEARPGRRRDARQVAVTVLGSAGQRLVIEPVLKVGRATIDPAAGFRDRSTSFIWLMSGATMVAVNAGSWMARRRGFAVYRIIGLDPPRIGWFLWLETLGLSIVPFLVGASLAVTAWPSRFTAPIVLEVVELDLARVVSLLTLLPIPALGLLLSRDPLHQVRAG